jgi:hypothetical protein
LSVSCCLSLDLNCSCVSCLLLPAGRDTDMKDVCLRCSMLRCCVVVFKPA